MARPCCRRERTAGGEDFTPTELIDRAGLAELDALMAGAEQVAGETAGEFPARPAYPPAAVWQDDPARATREIRLSDLTAGELAEIGAAVVSTNGGGASSTSGDQLADDIGLMVAVRAAELAERAGIRLPVPRRPWRRVWCWATGGHQWFPCVGACLDCGKPRG